MSYSTDEMMKAATSLWETLVDEEHGSSYNPSLTAFRKVNGAPFFEYYEKHVSPQ